MKPYWKDVFPAVTTQFHQDQSLDLEATARHFEVLIDSGVAGLIVCGSLGENQTLQPDEKRAVVKCAVATAKGRVPVLSGVAEMSTLSASRYMQDCADLGAAGFMVMPSMVYKADNREVMHWFRTMAKATPLPWMLYNNPVGYVTDVTPEMFVELADVENLVAIKESSANPRRITELRNLQWEIATPCSRVSMICCWSAPFSVLMAGWQGAASLSQRRIKSSGSLLGKGRWDEARALYRWSQPLMKLDTHTHFVQYIKLLEQETGLGKEWVREPRMPLAGAEREQVLKIIRDALAKRPA